MEKQEFAVKMYKNTSAQFLIRVRQRDAVLLFYVAAVGSVFGLTSEQGSLWFAAVGMGSVGVACVLFADLMHILRVRRRIWHGAEARSTPPA